ncbi:hypothetical protein Leryth_027051 [Lithospermum erythrorhizon]|nr:hypothetical protein Leryth_027051 [Lithospermum erythrorhizon]
MVDTMKLRFEGMKTIACEHTFCFPQDPSPLPSSPLFPFQRSNLSSFTDSRDGSRKLDFSLLTPILFYFLKILTIVGTQEEN